MIPQFCQEMQRHTFKIIYHIERVLRIILFKYTHHMTSSVEKKSVLLIRAHQVHLKKRRAQTPTVLLSDNILSAIIE